MPLIHRPFINDQPVVPVLVGVSDSRAVAMATAGVPVPASITLNLLIDTGTGRTALDQAAIASLGLAPTGRASVHTASTAGTPHDCNLYDVSLLIPTGDGGPPFRLAALPVLEGVFRNQGIDGLLGRDILRQFVFIYNGPLGGYTLAH